MTLKGLPLNAHQKIIYEILRKHQRLESGKLFMHYSRNTDNHLVDRSYRYQMKHMVDLGLVRAIVKGRWKEFEIVI
jgi:repressor of nif and glnA expression